MINKEIIGNIRQFIINENRKGKLLTYYKVKSDLITYFKNQGIKVGLEENKEIILQEETHLELGGMERRSFSIVYPINDSNLIDDGNIIILGPETHQILEKNVDFGLFIIIGVRSLSKKDYNEIKSLNFLSNGIEGFSIRTIPRRFWCRISKEVFKKDFSFEFLTNAIIYLYRQKFKDLIENIEIIIICSYPDSIENFIEISSDLTDKFREQFKAKIDEWKKRIDCEYDWGCEICPYQEECYNIKQVLVERERIGE
ncbi:MAG: hypothetical protein ACFE9Q_07550 [Candidatus Hodarchaeota archaeon]